MLYFLIENSELRIIRAKIAKNLRLETDYCILFTDYCTLLLLLYPFHLILLFHPINQYLIVSPPSWSAPRHRAT